MSVRRGLGHAACVQDEACPGTGPRLFGRVRNFAGWTRNAEQRATNELERAINDITELESPAANATPPVVELTSVATLLEEVPSHGGTSGDGASELDGARCGNAGSSPA